MHSVYQQRLDRVRENMKEQGLPQILVSSTESVFYLTGLWIVPMERAAGAVSPRGRAVRAVRK